MRFAVISDTHIGRSIPLAVADYRRLAFERAFTKAVDATVEARVDYVFVCGDLFERRSLRPHMVTFAHDELYRLAIETEKRHGHSIKILVIRGNHDGRPQSDALDYIKHPLAGYLHVFGDDDHVYRDNRVTVVGLNYYDQIDRAYEAIAKPELQKATGLKILLLHGFVSGYNDVPPYNSSVTLDQLAAGGADYVFTGHYHKRCKPRRLSSGGWILTPGSTEVYDFAEGEEKGFYIVDTEGPDFTWVPIEPLHLMRQVAVASDRRQPPIWFEEEIAEKVRGFAEELRAKGKQGYLRVRVTGQLSDGWPSDIGDAQIREAREAEPRLLYVEVDTMDLELPPGTAVLQHDNTDVAAYFSAYGTFADEIREMHGRVRETLEEDASTLTGLLTATQRAPLVQEWLRRFESYSFKEEKP